MSSTMTFWRLVNPVFPALVVLGFFVWFANWIPQTRWEPPKSREITARMTPAELAKIGTALVRERGCLTCHTIEPAAGIQGQGRGPNFAGLAARRANGVPGGASDLASYLTQSLYEPGAYVVEGYANIMPPTFRPPAKLSYEETTAVVDYLMSLGGTPSVKVGDLPKQPGGTKDGETSETAATDPAAILEKYACLGCHALKTGEEMPGPPLVLASLRESATARGLDLEAYLMESIVKPRAFVHGDFQPDLMPEDLGNQLSAVELYTIVTYLASLEAAQ